MSTDKLPQNDAELKTALEALFKPWEKKLKEKFEKELKEKLEGKLQGKKFGFITDGALPGYSKQELKILYLAREMHTTEGLKDNPEKRNIVEFVDAFLSGRRDSRNSSSEAHAVYTLTTGKNKNILPCWRLAARIAYCVCQGGKIGLSEKPSPEELQKKLEGLWTKPSFEELQSAYNNNKNEFSFAILEISKYNNIVKSPKAPGISKEFKNFADESLGMGENAPSRNFIREEIELLNPDLIISWNIRSVIAKRRFRKLLIDDPKCKDKDLERSCSFLPERAWTYTFDKIKDPSDNTKKKQIPLLDTYHFSVDDRRKNRQKELFNPVMRALKELGLI